MNWFYFITKIYNKKFKVIFPKSSRLERFILFLMSYGFSFFFLSLSKDAANFYICYSISWRSLSMYIKKHLKAAVFTTLWTVAHQASLSMGFSRQEYWCGLLCPPPGNLPNPGIKPAPLTSPALAGRFFTTRATWEALKASIRSVKKEVYREFLGNPVVRTLPFHCQRPPFNL